MHAMNRRAVLAGAATLPALAIPVPASEADPIFTAIERHREGLKEAAEDEWTWVPDHRALLDTESTTLAGLRASLQYIQAAKESLGLLDDPELVGPLIATVVASLDRITRQSACSQAAG